MKFHLASIAVLAVMVTAACSSPSTNPPTARSAAAAAPSAATTSATITLTNSNQFQPADITVARGATVTWVNQSQMPHTVTDDPAKASKSSDAALPPGAQTWDSGIINPGQSFSHTFDTPGQYTYFCIPHESLGMVGHITVM